MDFWFAFFFSGETGIVEKIGSINMQKGSKNFPDFSNLPGYRKLPSLLSLSLEGKRGEAKEEVLEYLKEIKPGMIVLVASFGDVTPK